MVVTPKDMILRQLEAGKQLFEQFTEDFSEEDAHFQPCEGGTHLVWILLHLATSEDWVVSVVGGKAPALGADLHQAYRGGPSCRADDKTSKQEAWRIFCESRDRTMEFVDCFDESRYEQDSPQGTSALFPRVVDLINLLAFHPFWHFGQLTVNRRLLNKPSLFQHLDKG